MKLYTKPGACSTADHIVLNWVGADYEFQILTAEEKAADEYKRLNPAGVVPTLVDGEFVLTQNAAILGYLADLFPDSGITGDGSPRDRAEATRWIAYVNSDLHPAFKPLFAPTVWAGPDADADKVRAAARKRIAEILVIAERRLDNVDWLPGFRGGADAYFYVTLRWATAAGIDLGPNCAAFLERIEADAVVRQTLADEGLSLVGAGAAAG